MSADTRSLSLFEPRLADATAAPGPEAPIVVTCRAAGVDVAAWGRENAAAVDRLLDEHKAVLFRRFPVDSVERFEGLLIGLATHLLDYSERSTPRSSVGAKVYTSTEYPKAHEIPIHNENSYSLRWPRRLFFCCLQPAERGGATPIADSRAVYEAIDEAVRETFLDKGVMYVRNYGQGIDLGWPEAFQTEDRRAVEAYCRESGIAYEWFEGGACLHTHQVRPAALCHRPSGARVWFNQAHLFHVSGLEPSLRASLAALFPPDRLPRNAYYGDGTPIADDLLDGIRNVYKRVRRLVEWRKGDVLLLDNLFYAHGRLPYIGERKVIVAMDCVGGDDAAPLPIRRGGTESQS